MRNIQVSPSVRRREIFLDEELDERQEMLNDRPSHRKKSEVSLTFSRGWYYREI